MLLYPTLMPILGLDLILKIWKKLATNQFIEYAREILSVPGHTVSVPVLNMPLIVTEDTENIKAVMSTQVRIFRCRLNMRLTQAQFSEFEKGEVFHKIWDCVLGTSIFSCGCCA